MRGQIHHGSSNYRASSHPLGRRCPGSETDRISLVTACAEALASISSSRHACTQRFNADDTCAVLKQLAEPGATHDKLTSNGPLFSALRAFATLSAVCLSPASHGSKVPASDRGS